MCWFWLFFSFLVCFLSVFPLAQLLLLAVLFWWSKKRYRLAKQGLGPHPLRGPRGRHTAGGGFGQTPPRSVKITSLMFH
jgi:hypothetical protein